MSQQHLTVVVHRLNEDLLLADGQVIEAVLSLAVPVLLSYVDLATHRERKKLDPSLQFHQTL